jgi:hypothetical protein
VTILCLCLGYLEYEIANLTVLLFTFKSEATSTFQFAQLPLYAQHSWRIWFFLFWIIALFNFFMSYERQNITYVGHGMFSLWPFVCVAELVNLCDCIFFLKMKWLSIFQLYLTHILNIILLPPEKVFFSCLTLYFPNSGLYFKKEFSFKFPFLPVEIFT